VNSQTVAQVKEAVQHPHGHANPNPELDAASKRLLLGAHLNLVAKKLRRGLSVEEREIVALIPFTIPNNPQADAETHDEIGDEPAGSVVDASDEHWAKRLAEVHQCSGIEANPR